MSLTYDTEKFNAFRKLAITDVSNLVIGKTYFTNTYPETFTLTALLTEMEHRVKWRKQTGVDIGITDVDNVSIAWAMDETGRTFSLHDRNIGSSYNPWLVFDNEALATACRETLAVSFNDSYDRWDDWATEILES